MDVGHVHFDDGAFQNGQGIANAIAVVRPGAGIDHDGINAIGVCLVNFFNHDTFKIRLKAFHAGAQVLTQFFDLRIYFGQSDSAVLGGVALAKHVQVDAVQTQNFHDHPLKWG
jgi:hypothetical protein